MLRMRHLRTCCNHRLRHAAASTFQSRAPKVCSRIGWASTRGRTNLSALGSCTSVAAPPVSSTSTMTPGVPAAHLLMHTRSAHTQQRPLAQTPAHTCRIYSHGRSRLPLLPQPGLVDPRKDRRARWSRRTNEHGRLPARGEWHLDRVEWQHLQQRLRPPGGVLELHGLRVRALPRVRR